jgi:DNA repair protein RecO (recombination protein O)
MIESPFTLSSNYECGLALDFMAEVAEHLLPAEEVNERYFRLMLAMIEHLRTGQGEAVWAVVLYYSLWAVRLTGILGELRVRDDSAEIAQQMLLLPVAKLPEREWTKATARDLRRALIQEIERHVERKLFTVPMLENL